MEEEKRETRVVLLLLTHQIKDIKLSYTQNRHLKILLEVLKGKVKLHCN